MTNPKTPDLEAFKDLPLDELQEVQNKLKNFVEKRMENRKKEALQQIKHLVQEYELTFEDVTKVIRTAAKRGKAPPLYRNPENPRQTWSGKGEAPDWYTTAPNKEALRISEG